MSQGNQTTKPDFGLPDHGAFSDPHDSQRQDMGGDRKASISTQGDFTVADVLKKTFTGGNSLSFEPTTTNVGDSSVKNAGDN